LTGLSVYLFGYSLKGCFSAEPISASPNEAILTLGTAKSSLHFQPADSLDL